MSTTDSHLKTGGEDLEYKNKMTGTKNQTNDIFVYIFLFCFVYFHWIVLIICVHLHVCSVSGTLVVGENCSEAFQEMKLRRKHRYVLYKIGEEAIEGIEFSCSL